MQRVTHRPPLNPLAISLLAFLVGLISGIGAVIFRGLISFFHNLLFLGKFSITYEANVHTPASPWGLFVVLVPVIGAVGVTFLVTKFAPEAKGHGVPEVMDSIYYNRGIIRPVVGLVKSIASALSIGSGGSVGREGPIIQIGSSFGSTLGQFLLMPAWQRVTLIACGTGAGIAATFNTPIGGMLFAIEIMLQEVSVRTLVPVMIATATATYIGQIFFGVNPAFVIPELQAHAFDLTHPLILLSYLGLGSVMGVASALYIRSIYSFEDFFEEHMQGSHYRRHILGMLFVGVLIALLMHFFGHYYVEGVGYATIQDILTGKFPGSYLFILLFVLKLLATSVTLGSGASGGIFSPALFLGATLGGAYAALLKWLFPFPGITIPAFAIAGMAGIVGGATGAAMAAIVMIFEMTLDYNVILPITITVAVSNGIRWFLSKETIYTLKLSRRGHVMPKALQTNFQYLRRAKDLMESPVVSLPASTTMEAFARQVLHEPEPPLFLVEHENEIVGTVSREQALKALESETAAKTLGEVASRGYVVVLETETLFNTILRMLDHRASTALVASREEMRAIADIKGVLTNERVAQVLAEEIELFSE